MWSLRGDARFERVGKIFNNSLGRFAYKNLHFFARVMLPSAWGNKRKRIANVQRHYIRALPTQADRQGT
jgi:hypothetical protein